MRVRVLLQTTATPSDHNSRVVLTAQRSSLETDWLTHLVTYSHQDSILHALPVQRKDGDGREMHHFPHHVPRVSCQHGKFGYRVEQHAVYSEYRIAGSESKVQ